MSENLRSLIEADPISDLVYRNQETQIRNDFEVNDNPIKFQKYDINVESFNEEKREIKFTFSTGRVDRSNDIVNPQGAILDDFLKNPVFLWMHDKTIPPIGKVVAIEKQGNVLIGVVEFWKNSNSPEFWSESDRLANSIYEQYKNGFLKAVSVAFRPVDATYNRETGGNNYNSYTITEISAVTVPDNPDALIRAKSIGIDTEIVKSYCEKTLEIFKQMETSQKEEMSFDEIIKSINEEIQNKIMNDEIIQLIEEELDNV